MGSIFRRKQKQSDGSWTPLPTWWVQFREHGRVRRESTHSTKISVARNMLRDREGAVRRGEPIEPRKNRITFDDGCDDIVTNYRVNKQKSLPDLKRRIKLHLMPFFRGMLLIAIQTADVMRYVSQRQDEGAENATINRELAALKRIFNLAIQGSKLSHACHVPMLREDNVRVGFFEREQFEAVRRHLPAPLQPVATFAYLTGWRTQSEVQPLELRQVDFHACTVRLDPGSTKNGKGRVFDFSLVPELKALLEAQRDQSKALAKKGTISPYLFSRGGKAIKDFRGAWTAACKAAGLPGKLRHDFRRTAVRNLVRANVSEQVAMKMTGHLTASVFKRYDIISNDDLREAGGKLAASMAGTRTGTNDGK